MTPDDLRLECRPGKGDGCLTFDYRLTNLGAAPMLVMDAMPRARAEGGVVADRNLVSVMLRGAEEVLLGHVLPLHPPDRVAALSTLPLCVRLAPGGSVERHLEVPLPLAEGGPFFADLSLRGYVPVALERVVLAVGWWPDNGAFSASETPWAREHLFLQPLGALPAAGLALQAFAVKRLELLKRTDDFPRTLRGHAAPG